MINLNNSETIVLCSFVCVTGKFIPESFLCVMFVPGKCCCLYNAAPKLDKIITARNSRVTDVRCNSVIESQMRNTI